MLKSSQEMITIKKRFLITILTVLVFCILCSLFIKRTYTKTEYGLFDTVCTVTVTDRKDNTEEYMGILRSIDNELNIYSEESPVYKLNHGEEVVLSDDIFAHLEKATNYSNKMPGYFDITLNPVSQLWNNAIDNIEPPQDAEAMREYIGTKNIILDSESNTAKITKEGASITLGATAKGFATTKLLDEIKKNRAESALINLGGNIYAHGTKPDGSLWTVGIADPVNPAVSAVILECKDLAVITSGDYERYFEKDGKRYHHIIDPATLMPAESGIHSATAIGRDAELCDIMSTALFVADVNGAKEICLEHGIDAILISDDKIYYTNGAEDLIKSADEKYALIKL